MNTENNKIIAEFMGLVECSIPNNYYTKRSSEGFGCGKLVDKLPYDTDWNWLIPVVEKIESLTIKEKYGEFNEKTVDAKISFSIENAFCQILSNGMYLNEIVSIEGNSKIEAVYNTCIFFIKWYNEQKN